MCKPLAPVLYTITVIIEVYLQCFRESFIQRELGKVNFKDLDADDQTHRVNKTKTLHTMHKYLFVQQPFKRTNLFMHVSSRQAYANMTITYPN